MMSAKVNRVCNEGERRPGIRIPGLQRRSTSRFLGEGGEEFGQGHIQTTRQLFDGIQSRAPFGPLYKADLGAMQPASLSQILLRQPALLPELSNSVSKPRQQCCHAYDVTSTRNAHPAPHRTNRDVRVTSGEFATPHSQFATRDLPLLIRHSPLLPQEGQAGSQNRTFRGSIQVAT